MLRKFISGLIFGAGFAIAFIVVFAVYFRFFLADTLNQKMHEIEKATIEVPEIKKENTQFLGSTGIYNSDFSTSKSNILASGEGIIKGQVTKEHSPAEGLKLRLALNGKVMSQWATTNSQGEYEISVPFGKYKIDGFELDSVTANEALSGLINSPTNPHRTGIFTVAKDKEGLGINLRFVKPVLKMADHEVFDINQSVVLKWEPYEGAEKYRIQVYEKNSPHEYIGNDTLFVWSERPFTNKTSLSLKDYPVKLQKGKYYVFEVVAFDGKEIPLSNSVRSYQDYDFGVK